MAKQDLILVGGGGHCHAVIDVIELSDTYHIAGIIDTAERINETVMGYSIIGCDEDLPTIAHQYSNALITVGQLGTAKIRERLYSTLNHCGFTLPTVISPLAYVAKTATIAEGTIVMHHALVNANAVVGKNCIINTKALIEHDAIINDFCHVATGAVVNGGVKLTHGSFIGSNATSKQSISISGFIKAGEIAK